MNKITFQVLVIVNTIISLLAGVYDYLIGTEESRKAIEFVTSIESEANGPEFYILLVFAGLGLAIVIVSVVGLLLLKNWGRKLYILSFGLAIVTYPFIGVSVFSGIGQLLNDASFVLSGFLLSVMYMSKLSQEFTWVFNKAL
jgi:hypothetical protein